MSCGGSRKCVFVAGRHGRELRVVPEALTAEPAVSGSRHKVCRCAKAIVMKLSLIDSDELERTPFLKLF